MKLNKYIAFTLAETLIVMGIIGVHLPFQT